MSVIVKDKQLFKNYTEIWEKIESLMRKKFDSKPFYGNDDNNYIKTKIKTFKDSIITNFHNKKVPEEKIPNKCLLIIVLDSVIKTDKYYPQTFLEECVYKQQEQTQQKQKNYITEELKSDSDPNNESESESDSDSNNESESDSDSNDDERKSDIDNDKF